MSGKAYARNVNHSNDYSHYYCRWCTVTLTPSWLILECLLSLRYYTMLCTASATMSYQM